jgi:molybdate transport system permease protein
MTSIVTPEAMQAIVLTLKLASLTTLLLLLIATPLAWWLSQTQSRWRAPVSAVVTLPLVLPPTVLGFYILIVLGPQGWVGQLTQSLGLGVLSFSFTGLLIGSIIFSLPFAVQPIQYAFEAMGRRPMEVAATLRAEGASLHRSTLNRDWKNNSIALNSQIPKIQNKPNSSLSLALTNSPAPYHFEKIRARS